jgi:hypothetical protein
VAEVGVTMYSTVPEVVLLGLVSTWLIVEPEPADAPEMLPFTVPTVHVKVEGVLDVSEIFGLVPLHVVNEEGLVTTGFGFTVTTIE